MTRVTDRLGRLLEDCSGAAMTECSRARYDGETGPHGAHRPGGSHEACLRGCAARLHDPPHPRERLPIRKAPHDADASAGADGPAFAERCPGVDRILTADPVREGETDLPATPRDRNEGGSR